MTDNPAPADHAGITVYSRPGCPFCTYLRRDLQRTGLPYTEIDIWQDPDAAAFVRSVANGNETVPTVTVGPISVVNPPIAQVEALVAEHIPHLRADIDTRSST